MLHFFPLEQILLTFSTLCLHFTAEWGECRYHVPQTLHCPKMRKTPISTSFASMTAPGSTPLLAPLCFTSMPLSYASMPLGYASMTVPDSTPLLAPERAPQSSRSARSSAFPAPPSACIAYGTPAVLPSSACGRAWARWLWHLCMARRRRGTST